MNIVERQAGDVHIVELEGKLDTTSAEAAETFFGQLPQQDITKLLINLGRLDFITSAGLRVLLVTAQTLDDLGGEMRLCGLNPTVSQVFRISGFDAMLRVFGTEAEALQDF